MTSDKNLKIAVIFIIIALMLFVPKSVFASEEQSIPKLKITLNNTDLETINAGSKDIKYKGNTVELINTSDESYSFREEDVEIKGRGNFSWGLQKKSYQIKFDSKYFSKLLNTSIDFNRNFVRLIEFMKLNPKKNLNEIRNILPEKNTKTFEEYEDLGLIEQIEANLDTKRQFQDNKLDYEWWNNYDENFKGNKFDVEIDTKLEYENLRFNLINEINGNLIDKINSKEKEKLFKKLENGNYSILNFEILKNNQVAQHSEIGTLIEKILNHIKTEQYWKSAIENDNIEIPQEEKDAITAFYDHIKGYKKKFNDIKNGRCINNLSFRLADSSNIGRNLFFGNHVGCCNSVESAYAGFSAPQHLLNSYIRGLEIIDEYGNSYGNTLCYFALSDNKISFVIDSFEANGKLASNSIVVENLIKFAKQICEKIGAKDAQIIAGPNFGNLDFSSYPSYISKEFKIIGTVSEYTYCDTVGGKTKDNINQKLIDQIKYYKLS